MRFNKAGLPEALPELRGQSPSQQISVNDHSGYQCAFGVDAQDARGTGRRVAGSPAHRVGLDHQHYAVRGSSRSDSAAAAEAASLTAERHKAGRPVEMRDTQIAGIALARRATLATRNVRHFSDLKVPVVDPWEARDR